MLEGLQFFWLTFTLCIGVVWTFLWQDVLCENIFSSFFVLSIKNFISQNKQILDQLNQNKKSRIYEETKPILRELFLDRKENKNYLKEFTERLEFYNRKNVPEIWATFPTFEKYRISNFGEIRRVLAVQPKKLLEGKILAIIWMCAPKFPRSGKILLPYFLRKDFRFFSIIVKMLQITPYFCKIWEEG